MVFGTLVEDRELTQKLVEAVLEKEHAKIEELFNSENKPNVDAEFNGMPLIIYAAQKKDWQTVNILYDNFANLDAKIELSNWHLIHECVLNAPDNVFNALIQYCDLNVRDRYGKTPLMVLIEEGKLDRAEKLLKQGISVAITDKNNENAGHYAARKNAYDILLSLGEKKLPFNQLNKSNESVLDLIEDLSFKENLPKMIGKLIKEENKEELVENKEVVDGNQVVEVEKPKKIGGLSSIKRK